MKKTLLFLTLFVSVACLPIATRSNFDAVTPETEVALVAAETNDVVLDSGQLVIDHSNSSPVDFFSFMLVSDAQASQSCIEAQQENYNSPWTFWCFLMNLDIPGPPDGWI